MLDQVKIVDMADKRKPGGPVVAIASASVHPVDLMDRARPAESNGTAPFPWRRVVILSLGVVLAIWIVSVI
ncbi:hypothetical protein GRZ55_18885 [Chelativorans sp. ZYF759]|uniref:hypothetical protein n=1 Tax=Chelativorans sp. ZYF759 TaxID=2692213 RepID=UPI00145CE629|nr:hypothetical protein [Chelativorans sp. ZYF759]NMG41314.1 hypothetical protein [Chelativorans sp. ZYF759]